MCMCVASRVVAMGHRRPMTFSMAHTSTNHHLVVPREAKGRNVVKTTYGER